jgi:protein-L-isoaspartate(D-aspartate) O-methyltransferase
LKNITGFKIYLCLIYLILLTCQGKQSNDDHYAEQRKSMVEHQLKARGIKNPLVLSAMMTIQRHMFVPEQYRKASYSDAPLLIGYNQTISQPFIVAYMTEKLNPHNNQKVLEVGTGSGYQAAVLSKLYKEVYTVEIISSLGEKAKELLKQEGCNNVKVKIGDGYQGWIEYAPFDAIIVTCAPESVPSHLVEQLAEGGKMIIPLGGQNIQMLYLLEKKDGKIRTSETLQVMFVPMVKSR